MQAIVEAFLLSVQLVFSGDADLYEIIALSIKVSLTATLLSCVIGLPIGALLAVGRFRFRSMLIVFVNALMGMPPVVVGLIVYLYLSRAGPFGWLGLLYTPTAMILAQTLLITPIVAALSRQVLEDLYLEYAEQFRSMNVTRMQAVSTILWDGRFSLLTVSLAGFGRSIAEVGAVIIVGGNIEHLTRVMTTAIALETSKGELPMALALGIVLLVIALSVNALVAAFRLTAARAAYA